MKEPISVLTNLAYLVPAGFAFSADPVTAKVYGGACITLAAASGLFHYYYRPEWKSEEQVHWQQTADEISMYVVLSFAIAHIGFLLGTPTWVVLGLAGVLSLIMAELWARIDSFTAVPILAGVLLFLAAIVNYVLAGVAGAVVLIAYVIRQKAEHSERFADAGHGLWHVLNAAALTAVLLF